MSDFKPWEWYPEIWPTKAKFFTWLRGGLRRGLWEKSPIKLSFKNDAVEPPPEGYTGRAKSGTHCALSGEWEGKSKLEVDHRVGNVSLTNEDDILTFIKHLIPPPGSLQLVTKEAHKIKSYAERQGISYEEAVIKKKVIAFMKNPADYQFSFLTKYASESDALRTRKDREKFFTKLLEEGKIE